MLKLKGLPGSKENIREVERHAAAAAYTVGKVRHVSLEMLLDTKQSKKRDRELELGIAQSVESLLRMLKAQSPAKKENQLGRLFWSPRAGRAKGHQWSQSPP